MEPVNFFVKLYHVADCESVRNELEAFAIDISLNMAEEYSLLFGRTSQATYETLFNAKIEYRTMDVMDFMTGSMIQQSAWFAVEPAEVPGAFEGRMKYIELSHRYYPCNRMEE